MATYIGLHGEPIYGLVLCRTWYVDQMAFGPVDQILGMIVEVFTPAAFACDLPVDPRPAFRLYRRDLGGNGRCSPCWSGGSPVERILVEGSETLQGSSHCRR